MFRKEKGFTLIEALIVIVIIGIIAAVAIPKFVSTQADANRKTCQGNLSTIQSAVANYKFNQNTTVAPTWAELVAAVPSLFETTPTCPAGGAYSVTDGIATCDFAGDGSPHALPSG